ncbi:MAG: dihydroneopterin aldolase [Bacteroidetes bacterium]|nr:dihydroneopterin aldolase [Bacteroidota bacterium]
MLDFGRATHPRSNIQKQTSDMNTILVEGINIYAHHGCLEEEGRIGCNYVVDVTMETDFTEAAKTDDLTKTIDYVIVYNIVKAEMAIRSKLIEHVGQRIVDTLKKEFAAIKVLSVKVSKINPPMHGHVDKVSVVITG